MKLRVDRCRWCRKRLMPEEGTYEAGRHFCCEYHKYDYRKWYRLVGGKEPTEDDEKN